MIISAMNSDTHAQLSAKAYDVAANHSAPSRMAPPIEPGEGFLPSTSERPPSRQPRALFWPVVIVGGIFGSWLGYMLIKGSGGGVDAARAPASNMDSFLKDLDAKPARNDPAVHKLIMAALDDYGAKGRQAISAIEKQLADDNYLSSDQKQRLKAMFGEDILSRENLSSLRVKLINTVHGLDYLKSYEENGSVGPVIYVGDFARHPALNPDAPAYTPSSQGGRGLIILNKKYVDDLVNSKSDKKKEEVGHIMAHESTHMRISTDDHWYGPEKPTGADTSTALNNADSIAYGIDFLSGVHAKNAHRKDET